MFGHFTISCMKGLIQQMCWHAKSKQQLFSIRPARTDFTLWLHGEINFHPGVTVNIYSSKKALLSTYLLANQYSPVFFSQNKKTPGGVYLPVNKYGLGNLLPYSYSVSIIGHNSHRFTPKPSFQQIKSKFLRNELVNKSKTSKFRKFF